MESKNEAIAIKQLQVPRSFLENRVKIEKILTKLGKFSIFNPIFVTILTFEAFQYLTFGAFEFLLLLNLKKFGMWAFHAKTEIHTEQKFLATFYKFWLNQNVSDNQNQGKTWLDFDWWILTKT